MMVPEENHVKKRNQKKKTHEGTFWFNDELTEVLKKVVEKVQIETRVYNVEQIDWGKVTSMFIVAVQNHPFDPRFINKFKLKQRYLNYALGVNKSDLSPDELKYLHEQIPKYQDKNKIQWKEIAKLPLFLSNRRTPNILKNKYYTYCKIKEQIQVS